MGDNGCDLLEKIALDYERENKDLVIVSNYIHKFNFKYIKEIKYVNYEVICKSWDDIYDNVYDKFFSDTEKYRRG